MVVGVCDREYAIERSVEYSAICTSLDSIGRVYAVDVRRDWCTEA